MPTHVDHEKRLKVYHETETDGQAAKVLGISQAAFWMWRQKRDLPSKGSRGGARHHGKPDQVAAAASQPVAVRVAAGLHREGQSFAVIAQRLMSCGIRTDSGCREWTAAQVEKLLRQTGMCGHDSKLPAPAGEVLSVLQKLTKPIHDNGYIRCRFCSLGTYDGQEIRHREGCPVAKAETILKTVS